MSRPPQADPFSPYHRLAAGATQGTEVPGSLNAMAIAEDDYAKKYWSGCVLRWRRLGSVGGLFLAVSFFLPAVDGCNSPIAPVQEVQELFSDPPGAWTEWAWVFSFLIAAYLIGFLALILGLYRFKPGHRADRAIGVANALVLGAVTVIYLVNLAMEPPGWQWGAVVVVGLGLFSLVYWLRCVRMGPAGLMSLRWYSSVLCLLWFFFWLVVETTYYGLWLSLLGSTAMLIGTTGEAKARSRLPLGWTIGQLLFGHRWRIDGEDNECRSCGYLLIGLTVPRCPECGAEFAWSDYAAELQLSSAPDPKDESTINT